MSGVIEVLLWTLGLSFLIAVMYRLLTNPAEMKRIKANMKEIQAKIKEAQKSNDTAKMNSLTSEMLKGSQQQFTSNMKPMMASMLIFVVFLWWLFPALYAETIVKLPFALPFFGSEIGYAWWYIVITLPFTLFFRKMLGAEL